MEQYYDTLQTQLLELGNGLETNGEKLTSDALSQARESLSSAILRINLIQNSRIPINGLIPDVLYEIFTFAVHDSTDPGMTTLTISHVCHHWRKSTSGWPTLWGFVDLNKSRSFIELFMNRSSNAPLAFSYNSSLQHNLESSRSYLGSCTNLASRVTSFTLHGSHYAFNSLKSILQGSGPLPLLNLDINLCCKRFKGSPLTAPEVDTLQIDISRLRELRLQHVRLPLSWLEFPPNKLTHFLFISCEPPPLSRLVAFLSTCSLLNELDIRIFTCSPQSIIIVDPVTSTLNFPNLRRLILVPDVYRDSHGYMQSLLTCFENLDHLSQFRLGPWLGPSEQGRHIQLAPETSESVLTGTSHFEGYHCLRVCYDDQNAWYRILSTPKWSPSRDLSSSADLVWLSGRYDPSTDPYTTFELVHPLPLITHLVLNCQAFNLLVSPKFDFCRVFPFLDTLRLSDVTDVLRYGRKMLGKLSYLPVDINLKTLTVECDDPELCSAYLQGIVSRIKFEVFELVTYVREHELTSLKTLVDSWCLECVSVFVLDSEGREDRFWYYLFDDDDEDESQSSS